MTQGRRGSRATVLTIAILGAAVLLLGAILWRVYPEYQRLRREAAVIQTPATEPAAEPVLAWLYFARIAEGKQRMVAISRELPPGVDIAHASLEELIRGEVPRGCDRPLPPGTSVLGIRVADKIAIVDFSEELVTNFRGGSDNEGVMVYSIVNTLTSLPTIDKVQILVAGKTVNEIGGHLHLGDPLAFDDELVVPYP
jgi:spore germination protein GerM